MTGRTAAPPSHWSQQCDNDGADHGQCGELSYSCEKILIGEASSWPHIASLLG